MAGGPWEVRRRALAPTHGPMQLNPGLQIRGGIYCFGSARSTNTALLPLASNRSSMTPEAARAI